MLSLEKIKKQGRKAKHKFPLKIRFFKGLRQHPKRAIKNKA